MKDDADVHEWNSGSESSPADEESIPANNPTKTSAFSSGYSMQRRSLGRASDPQEKQECMNPFSSKPHQRPSVVLKDLALKPCLPKLTEKIAPIEAQAEEESDLSTCRFPGETEETGKPAETSCKDGEQQAELDSPEEEISPLSYCGPGYEDSDIDQEEVKQLEAEKDQKPLAFLPKAKLTTPQWSSSLDLRVVVGRGKIEETVDEELEDGGNTPNFTMKHIKDPPEADTFADMASHKIKGERQLSPNFSSAAASDCFKPRERFGSSQINSGSPLCAFEALGSLRSQERAPSFTNAEEPSAVFGNLSKLSPLKRAMLLEKMGSPSGSPQEGLRQERQYVRQKRPSFFSLQGVPKDKKVMAILREERRNSSHSNSSQFSDRMSAFKQRLNSRSNSIFQHQVELEDVDVDNSNDDASALSSVSITGDSAMGISNEELRLRTVKLQSMKLHARRSFMLTHSFDSKYVLGDKLGEGQHSSVYTCHTVLDKEKQNLMAVKITREDDEEKKEAVRNEFKLMASLNHPNIAKAIEKFENDLEGKIYTVMTYHKGTELQEQIQSKHKNKLNSIYTEEEIRHLMKQILDAVRYLHYEKQIAHRDLKSDNFIVSTDGKNTVHMIDFNVSRSFESRRLMTKTGTPHYNAPEIYSQKQYDEKVDVWSSGVILYMLITGELPFVDSSISALINQIVHKEPDFDLPLFSKYSQSCKALLKRMLSKDPAQRPSASECLSHRWFSASGPTSPIDILESPSSQPAHKRRHSMPNRVLPQEAPLLPPSPGSEDHQRKRGPRSI